MRKSQAYSIILVFFLLFGIMSTDALAGSARLVGFSNATTSVNEGSVARVTVTRSNGSGTASVMYGTHGVTAVSSTTNGDDYNGFDPITLTFAEGETRKVVSVQTLNNSDQESAETFEIYLTSPSTGYDLDTNRVATVTIIDNDVATNEPATIGFSKATASVNEGSVVNVTVTRSNGAGTASVMYGTRGVTAVSSTTNGDDYKGFDPITLTFAEGETSKVVSVQTLNNSDQESAETFEIYLTSPSTGYDLDTNRVATVTIIDNDVAANEPATIGFSKASASVNEGSVVNVTVTRSNGAGTASVMYGTRGVTAVSSTRNGDDYKGFDPIAVTFAEGETRKVVSVQTLDNSDQESAETFEIYLASPSTGYELDTNRVATITIIDNDVAANEPSTIGFSKTTASVNEGSIVNVTVTRSNGAGTASVMYGTRGVTAVSSTTNGDDYKGFDPITLTFAEGETSKVISVQTLNNSDQESEETFEIYLTSPSAGYDLNTNRVATVTIVDNENAPEVADETGSTSLTWTAPSTREDGTSLSMSEIDGYRIYMGDTTSDMAPVMDINDNSLTSYTLSDLSAGTHYFALTAYDANGNESGLSNIVRKSAR